MSTRRREQGGHEKRPIGEDVMEGLARRLRAFPRSDSSARTSPHAFSLRSGSFRLIQQNIRRMVRSGPRHPPAIDSAMLRDFCTRSEMLRDNGFEAGPRGAPVRREIAARFDFCSGRK